MGLHQKPVRSVSPDGVILGAYYQGQDSAGDPDEYLTLAPAVDEPSLSGALQLFGGREGEVLVGSPAESRP